MKKKIKSLFLTLHSWQIILFSILGAVFITDLITALISLWVWGEVQLNLILLGTINAIFAPLIILPAILGILRKMVHLEEQDKINKRVILQLEEQRQLEANLHERELILEAVNFAAEQLLKTADWRTKIDSILERLGKTIKATHTYIFEHHTDTDGVEYSFLKYEWTAAGHASDFDNPYYQTPNPIKLDENSTDHSLRQGHIFMGNSSMFPNAEKERLLKLGVKSMLEVPLFVGGAWWGTFGFDDFENEREWSSAEVDALKIAVGILGAAIQRQGAESAVQESERIYRQAIEAADAIPYYRDYKNNCYAFMGEGILEISGYPASEITPQTWDHLIVEGFPRGSMAHLTYQEAARLTEQGILRHWECDYRIVNRHGQTRWVADSCIQFHDEQDARIGVIGILQDITDRKLTEANLHKRESILEAITFSAEQFLKAPDWREKMDMILERLGKEFNASHAYLFEKHPGANGELLNSLRYEWTAPGQKSDIDNPDYQNAPVHDIGYERYYQILDSGEPFVGSASTHTEAEKILMFPTGIKALLEMRIVVNGKQWGTLGFDDMVNEREWTSMEVDVLKVATNVLGAVIKRQADEEALKQELSERRRAEQALRLSEEKFSKAFHTTQVLMTIEDEKNIFIDANQAFIDAFDVERKDVIGHSASELNLFYDPTDAYALRQTLQEKSFLKDFELRFRRKSGEMGFALLSSEKFNMDNDEYILTSGLDITARKHAEADREKLIGELEAKNEELENFTYTVSHDLKSPLVTINGFLGYLEQDAASGNMERLKNDTHRIRDAVNKMQRLLNELLELSRIGRMMNEPEIISFDDLAREAINIVHGQLEARGVTVQIRLNLPAVYGDRPRLTEVLQNLLDNAVKYMGAQPSPQIEIGQRGDENGKPIFYVQDNGIGIAPEYHERVFGLFNKLDAATEGSGIGLALVKRILEVHGGRVWVESEDGNGSTFYFTLTGSGE